MLSFFRRLVFSPIGKIVALLLLVLIALAFAAGDITGLRPSGGTGGALLRVGSQSLGEAELRQRLQVAVSAARQENPSLDMSQFVNGGGFDRVVDQFVGTMALTEFAKKSGMVVSKQVVDGQIASIPAFQGPDGKFSQTVYKSVLEQQRLSPQQLRQDIENEMLVQWLLAPTIGATQVPKQLAMPFASLMLEKRAGTFAVIPASSMPVGNLPTDAELTAYYARHRAAYTVPERRAVRYAIVDAQRFATLKPTEAEVVAAYRAQASRFGASERRTIRQVIVADQKTADALAAKVKSGTDLAVAARTAGLEASTADKVDRTAFAQRSAPAVAAAAFGAAQGAVIGPVKGTLGFHVLRVEAVEKTAGKTVEQARAELATELATTKVQEALADLRGKLDDSVSNGATFAELVSDAGAQAQVTPALLPSGLDIANPMAKPDPRLQPILQGAFQAEQGDDPQMVPVGQDGSFAIVALERVVPAAPRPLTEIRENVQRDFVRDRQQKGARAAAIKVVAAVNAGQSLAQAMAATGIRAPAPQTITLSRLQLAQTRQQVPPPVALMFSLVQGKAKQLEAPNEGGYFVVHLTQVQKGDARADQTMVSRTRASIGQMVGREYVDQFTEAVKKQIGIHRDDAALAKLKAELGGQASAN